MAKLKLTQSDDDGHGRGPGRFAAMWSGLFKQGDNPINWALPLFAVSGIRVRLGLLYILFIAVELSRAAANGSIAFVGLAMGSLLVIVILHEFGHCIACRMAGGEADDILLWPLGGLASCNPPFSWRAHFWTTAGGPLVNVILAPIFALGLLAAGIPASALFAFNPFSPLTAVSGMVMNWPQQALWWVYYTNLVLLAFNVIVPMYPMDGGRLWQAVLWNRLGYRRSMSISVTVGLAAAVVLGMIGMFVEQFMLVGIAVFGGITCYQEKIKLQYLTGGGMGSEREPWAASAGGWRGDAEMDNPDDDLRGTSRDPAAAAERAEEQRRKAREKAAAEQAAHQVELDRILAKIKSQGMGSLTGKEKKVLEQETETKRRSG